MLPLRSTASLVGSDGVITGGTQLPSVQTVQTCDKDLASRIEGIRSLTETLCGVYPWEACARGQRVIYVTGAWAFLHPSHQNLLTCAAQRGDHLVVGIHDDETRIQNHT